jgi:hypothetical protein
MLIGNRQKDQDLSADTQESNFETANGLQLDLSVCIGGNEFAG